MQLRHISVFNIICFFVLTLLGGISCAIMFRNFFSYLLLKLIKLVHKKYFILRLKLFYILNGTISKCYIIIVHIQIIKNYKQSKSNNTFICLTLNRLHKSSLKFNSFHLFFGRSLRSFKMV